MAERRMFAKTIIDSDAFLDMPVTARLLYYDLGMRADDDGFVNSPKKIMKTIGASADDMNILVMRKFVIPFESGVVVIKHWRINNYLRKDRYTETNYSEEKSMLSVDETGNYHLINDVGIPGGIPVVDAGKDSIGNFSIDKNSIDILGDAPTEEKSIFIKLILNDKTEYEVTEDDVKEYQELYPAVDVKQQFRNMKGWCDANPTNRKTRSGIKRFINSWLSKEQNRGGYRPEMPQEKSSGKNFDANKGLMKGNYDFDKLEAETKNRHTEVVKEPIKEPEKKPESKLVAKLLSLPIDEDFRFVYQDKEYWGTRFEKSVAIRVKGGDFIQVPIERIEEYIEELPVYKK